MKDFGFVFNDLRIKLDQLTVMYYNDNYGENIYPTIVGRGQIHCSSPHFSAKFHIDKQPANNSFKLVINEGTLFERLDTQEEKTILALEIKRRVKIQIMDMIKEKCSRVFV